MSIDRGPEGGCTCRWSEGSYGRLDGVDMGRGPVRLTTTPGCPVHAACARYTAENRARYENGAWLYCPVHGRTACPPRRS